MFRFSFKLLIVFYFLSFWGCAAARLPQGQSIHNIPEWVNFPNKQYPQEFYFTGVGSGITVEIAKNNAFGIISRIFNAKIDVRQTVNETIEETNRDINSSTKITRETDIATQSKLRNIHVTASFFDRTAGIYYALAVLDRAETLKLYQDEITQNNDQITQFFNEYEKASKLLDQFKYLSLIDTLLSRNHSLKQVTAVLSINGETIPDPLPAGVVYSLLNALKGKITVNITASADAPAEVESYLEEMISKFGFKVDARPGYLTLTYNLIINPSALRRNDVFAYNWNYSVSLRDNNSKRKFLTFNVEQRAIGISEEQSYTKILRQVKKATLKGLYQKLYKYITDL